MACNGSNNYSTFTDKTDDGGSILDIQICIIGELRQNAELLKAAQRFEVPIVYSETGEEYIGVDVDSTTAFVLSEFEGDIYENLHKAAQRILGPTSLIQCSESCEPLPCNIRPLYTTSMRHLVVCFTGFRVKEDLARMVTLIHHMGGSIRKDFIVSKTTHLVANSTTGEKYRYAANYGIPIMRADWIHELWAQRHNVKCRATDENMIKFKLQPFIGCKIAFIGFQDDEKKHMEEVSIQNGGEVVLPVSDSCTHLVVEDSILSIADIFRDDTYKIHAVKTEWFWASIQMEARAEERIYVFEPPRTPQTAPSLFLPTSARGNKRKRLESVAHQLALESTLETEFCSLAPDHKRKSGEVAKLSISGSFLDATLSPEKSYLDTPDPTVCSVIKSPVDLRSLTPRQQVCMELLQTETNYVGILHTIMTVFKEPLEQPDQVGGPLLVAAEIKIIFGNLPPIYDVHQKLREELAESVQSWKEENSIGNLILKHSQDFMRAYPPFVNFFEKTKEVLTNCDMTKPRFHAFLKRCQSKPECGRQSLRELLIRPVQRLPSIVLLLNDVLKHTSKSNPDHQALDKAIKALKEVMMHINEDKRRTEGQVAMFDIVNDIENCPPNLLSSHRNFITRTDMQEIGDSLSRKGDTITMFLFTDVLEICKRRSRAVGTTKSPGVVSLASGIARTQQKCFKHLELMPLSHIKRVVDVKETEECKNLFAIVVRSNQELKERLYTFILLGEEVNKGQFLRTLCRHMANTVCRADAENFLTSLEPQQLALDIGDATGSALTKAIKIATKTRDKLGRALSIRKTPTKRGLNRAVSTIISPLRSIGTPNSTLRGFRLASVTNLTSISYIITEGLLPICGKRLKPICTIPGQRNKSRSWIQPHRVFRLHPLQGRR